MDLLGRDAYRRSTTEQSYVDSRNQSSQYQEDLHDNYDPDAGDEMNEPVTNNQLPSSSSIVAVDFSLDWTNVVQRFENKFCQVYSKSKKAHFDCLPPEYKVVDGARTRWWPLLLIDALLYLLQQNDYHFPTRRAFCQQQVLFDCIVDELRHQHRPFYLALKDRHFAMDVLNVKRHELSRPSSAVNGTPSSPEDRSPDAVSHYQQARSGVRGGGGRGSGGNSNIAKARRMSRRELEEVEAMSSHQSREHEEQCLGEALRLVDLFPGFDMKQSSLRWASIQTMRSQALEDPPSKSKCKFQTIVEFLAHHPAFSHQGISMKVLYRAVICKVLLFFGSDEIFTDEEGAVEEQDSPTHPNLRRSERVRGEQQSVPLRSQPPRFAVGRRSTLSMEEEEDSSSAEDVDDEVAMATAECGAASCVPIKTEKYYSEEDVRASMLADLRVNNRSSTSLSSAGSASMASKLSGSTSQPRSRSGSFGSPPMQYYPHQSQSYYPQDSYPVYYNANPAYPPSRAESSRGSSAASHNSGNYSHRGTPFKPKVYKATPIHVKPLHRSSLTPSPLHPHFGGSGSLRSRSGSFASVDNGRPRSAPAEYAFQPIAPPLVGNQSRRGTPASHPSMVGNGNVSRRSPFLAPLINPSRPMDIGLSQGQSLAYPSMQQMTLMDEYETHLAEQADENMNGLFETFFDAGVANMNPDNMDFRIDENIDSGRSNAVSPVASTNKISQSMDSCSIPKTSPLSAGIPANVKRMDSVSKVMLPVHSVPKFRHFEGNQAFIISPAALSHEKTMSSGQYEGDCAPTPMSVVSLGSTSASSGNGLSMFSHGNRDLNTSFAPNINSEIDT